MPKKLSDEAIHHILADAEQDSCFWVHDGPIIRNIYELRDSLKSMKDSSFSFHVSSSKNDFYSWVRGTLKDNDLAGYIKFAKTNKRMAEIIENRIVKLEAEIDKRTQKLHELHSPRPKKRIMHRIKSLKNIDLGKIKSIRNIRMPKLRRKRKAKIQHVYERVEKPDRIKHELSSSSMMGAIELILIFVLGIICGIIIALYILPQFL